MNTQRLSLDLAKRTGGQQVTIAQGDAAGTTIVATILDNGTQLAESGISAYFVMELPDHRHFVRDAASYSDGVITYVMDETHAASVAGYTDNAYFELQKGTTTVSTERFCVVVLSSASEGIDPAYAWTNGVEEFLDDASALLVATVNAASASVDAMRTDVDGAVDRANAAIDAMGDISEQAVPVMSADVRGGAKIQPDSGLEITNTDNLQVRLALESEGDVRGGLAQVTAKGHAEQVSTTGKNLLPREAISSSVVDGVTFEENQDGSFTANGTATANIGFAIGYTSPDDSLSEGTYTLSGCPAGGSQNTYSLRYFNNSTQISTYDYGNGGIRTLTSEQASKWNACWVYIMSGTTVNNLTFRPQFELGSTATDYEPYTGGLPSPRPDWEQPIEVVRGRNLLDEQWELGNVYGSNSTTRIRSKAVLQIEAGRTYSVSLGKNNSMKYSVATTDESAYPFTKSTYAGNVDTWQTGTYTFTATKNAYLGITLAFASEASIAASDGSNIEIQLALGSTPQPYVPYGHVGMEERASTGNWEQGAISSPSSARETYSALKASSTKRIRTAELVPLVIGDDYFVTVASGYECVIQAFSDDGKAAVPIPSFANTWKSSSFTFVATTPCIAIAIRYTTQADISVSEETSSACQIIHTTTPIPLPQRGWVAGLRDGTADVLTLDGAGHVEWEKETEEVVFDGSSDESWSRYSGGTEMFYFYYSLRSGSNPRPLLMSNRYIFIQHGNTPIAGTFIANGDTSWNGNVSFFPPEEVTEGDYALWREFLSSNPVTVLYPLATPVTEDCGYCEDWPTDIPEGATVTIPELDAVGVKYFIDSAVTELARQWYERAHSEYEDRIAALESAVADLATQ